MLKKVNKKYLIIGGTVAVVIIVIIGGFIAFKKLKPANRIAEAQQNSGIEEEKVEEKKPTVVKRPGEYTNYDAAKLAQAVDGKVVLHFCAKWSNTCKQLDKDFKANASKIPNNFTIMLVDYDKSAVMKKQYTVPFENTYVQVDAGGAMINRWSGSEYLEEVVSLAK